MLHGGRDGTALTRVAAFSLSPTFSSCTACALSKLVRTFFTNASSLGLAWPAPLAFRNFWMLISRALTKLRHSWTTRSLAWISSSKCAISAGRFATDKRHIRITIYVELDLKAYHFAQNPLKRWRHLLLRSSCKLRPITEIGYMIERMTRCGLDLIEEFMFACLEDRNLQSRPIWSTNTASGLVLAGGV